MVKDSARTFFSLPGSLRTKIISKLFPTAEQLSFEKISKSVFVDFSKTSDMLRFLEKYDKLPLGFHFSEDHFPLGGRIFSRSKFLSVNCIMKIIQFGGQSEKKRLIFFRLRVCQAPLFGLPAPSVGSNETVFWKKCSMLPNFFQN